MLNNTRYSASRIFTKDDLITTKKLLREDKSPKEMYQYLASRGDRYALFAGLRGSESVFWGKYTLYTSRGEISLDKEQNKMEESRDIDFKLASEYLKLLETKLNESGSKFVEILDIDHNELMHINIKACSESKFNIEDWYLYAVFESLSPNERQGFWTHRLNSSTELKEQINHHYQTFEMMIKKYILADGSKKELIKRWLNDNFYITQYYQLTESNLNLYKEVINSNFDLKGLIDGVNRSIKKEEETVGDVIPCTFHYVDPENLLTQDAALLMKNENILFWERKEEKIKFLMNDVRENIHNRRKKRSALFDVNEQSQIELHIKDVQSVCKKVEEDRAPQILYDYFEANGEMYGVIPNGLVRGESYAGYSGCQYM
ncbi:hypothetical protein ABN063_04520 [Providencia vermicola]|uniref:hypothetical protein n=1 Tax=Providencia vermicola TaxID=333965 RepID=UPI0032D9FFFF